MVSGQVREHRGVEPHAVHATLVEGVGRDLDRRRPRAQVHGPAQHPEQVTALRRGAVLLRPAQGLEGRRRGTRPMDRAAQGSDHRGGTTRPGQTGADQLGRRALAVGAGDADGQELPFRVAVEPRGHPPHAGAGIVDLQPRYGRRGRRRAEGQYRGGAPRHRVRSEDTTVVKVASPGDEQIAAHNAAGVVLNAHDFRVGGGKAQR